MSDVEHTRANTEALEKLLGGKWSYSPEIDKYYTGADFDKGAQIDAALDKYGIAHESGFDGAGEHITIDSRAVKELLGFSLAQRTGLSRMATASKIAV